MISELIENDVLEREEFVRFGVKPLGEWLSMSFMQEETIWDGLGWFWAFELEFPIGSAEIW